MTSWSYSKLNQFETCPSQYAAERVYKTAERTTNPQAIWGTEVHEALEYRLRDGKPLEERFEHYAQVAQAVEKMTGTAFFELEVALTKDKTVTYWEDSEAWGRGILDVLIVLNDEAIVIDWKTGKVKDDYLQLQLFALFVFHTFPKVNKVTAIFKWLKFKQSDKAVYQRADIDTLWKPILEKVERLEEAHETDSFVTRPSGLCRAHCSNTLCEYHGVGRRRY